MNMHALYYVKNFKEIKLLITNHAKSRLLQRYRLKLFQYEKERPELFIEKDIKQNGTIRSADFMSPFEMNKLSSRHGRYAFNIYSDNITYHCLFRDNKIVIKTITINN